jgi:hypothetical protein
MEYYFSSEDGSIIIDQNIDKYNLIEIQIKRLNLDDNAFFIMAAHSARHRFF